MNVWFIEVIQPVKREEPIDDPDWLNELKYDGFRALASFNLAGRCMLISKRHNRLPFRYVEKSLAACIGKRKVVLDGELCSLGKGGRPQLSDLMSHEGFIAYIAFDILELDGKDLTEKPLLERKKILAKLVEKIAGKTKRLQVATFIIGHSKAAFRMARRRKLEGIVVKHIRGMYKPGVRWYKVKDPHYKRRKSVEHRFKHKEEHHS